MLETRDAAGEAALSERLAAAEAELARLKLVTYPTPLERKLVQHIRELKDRLEDAEAHCLDVHGTECRGK